MTVESADASPRDRQLFLELCGILRDVTGEGAEWIAAITPNDRLEVDLGLESIELTALGELLTARYGNRVNLPVYYAQLEIDEIIGLTVGDLVGYLAAHTGERA
jgi:hypothetical protein